MTTEIKSQASVLAIVFALVVVIIGIQSCQQSDQYTNTDDVILDVGRRRLLESVEDPESIEILEDRVIRPGLRGGEFSYWARIRITTDSNQPEVREHYDE